MKRTYKRKLETPVGTFYLLYNDSIPDCYCALLDSDSKWITNIHYKATIKQLKTIQSIGDIVNILALQNCTWAQTIEELTEEINDIYYYDDECEDERLSTEEMKNYVFLNRVGTTYFVIDFE